LVLGEIGFSNQILYYKQAEDINNELYYPNEYFKNEITSFELSFDIWSLGCVFYLIYQNKKPFNSKEEIMKEIDPLNLPSNDQQKDEKKFLIKKY
jgi:serine/threonine protein kinase